MMNTSVAPARVSSASSGHLDPCAQEFTPGPYAMFQPAAPPPPQIYYSYRLDARTYVSPTAGACSIPVNPVLPLYNASDMGIPYPAASIQQPLWDNRQAQHHPQQQQQVPIGFHGDVNNHCLPLLPLIRPYSYNDTKNSSSTGGLGARSGSNVAGSNPGAVYPLGREHASRALLLSSVPVELSEEDLRQELEAWGPVRALDLERRREGLVTVLYYDLRHAKTGLTEIQEQHLMQQRRLQQHYNSLLQRKKEKGDEDHENEKCEDHDQIPPPPPPPAGLSRGLIGGKAIWAQYTIPVGLPPGPEGHNQGTLVVFNLDADIDTSMLISIFEAFGAVKELRETPTKRQHKFVEFFDVRDAARALEKMDGQEIGGKRVKIEFSRPGGQTRRPPPPPPPLPLQQPIMHASPPLHQGGSGGANSNHVHPVPMLIRPEPRQQFVYPRWTNTAELDSTWAQRPIAERVTHTSALNSRGGRGRSGGSGCLGRGNPNTNTNPNKNNINTTTNNSYNGRLRLGIDVRRRRGNGSHHQQQQSQQVRGELSPAEANGVKPPLPPAASAKFGSNNSARIHSETASHFAFDEAKAESNSSEARTTVMIKNIPNKYSQQMLLSMLDQHCISCNERITDPSEPFSAYDFVYLPIDFKNKCNLGYAFVNMTTSKATWKLYKAFHKQPWEAFNSRKICEVTYARVQGRVALEDHFRNSKFACDTDEYLPLVFSPPRNGEQLSTPVVMGGHIASHKTSNNNTSNPEEGRDSKAPAAATSAEVAANNKSYVPTTTNVYRNNNYAHRSSNVHDTNNFPLRRRLNAVQQKPMGGGGGDTSTGRVGCA